MTADLWFEVAAKASVLLLFVWILTRTTVAHTSAATRHALWAAALVSTLALPPLVFVAPSWRLAAVSGGWARAGGALERTLQGRLSADGEVWPPLPAGSHAPFTTEASRRAAAQAADGSTATLLPDWAVSSGRFLLRLWAFGSAIGLASLALGFGWAVMLVRRARPVTADEWLTSHAEALQTCALPRVPLLMSERVGVPVVAGVFRPALIVPVDALTWEAERRRVVLLHELGHVRRRDCLMQSLAHLAWAMLWWNPLASVAVARMRTEQEHACDDLVLATGTSPTAYATHLCEIARRSQRTFPPALLSTLAVARPSRIEARITAILDECRNRRPTSTRLRLTVATVGALSVISLGPLRLADAASPAASDRTTAAVASDVPATDVVRPRGRMRPARPDLTADAGQAFLDRYCGSCHGVNRGPSRLALDRFSPDHVAEHPDAWERVVRKIRVGWHVWPGVEAPRREEAETFYTGLEALLDRVGETRWTPEVAQPLTDFELAERLAHFLWNAPPDETLTGLTRAGRLREPAVLEREVGRLLADQRSASFITRFFGEWLSLDRLPTLKLDPAVFPEFTASLRAAFAEETTLFVTSLVREDRPVTELITAPYTFLNDELSRHYGVTNVSGREFRRVLLPGDHRVGLLGHGSFLTLTSFPQRTSPVVRGKWLLQDLLGLPPLVPPPNVPPLAPFDPQHPSTMRTRLERHRQHPFCASCHVTMDPLGLALENFDAIARWRTTEGGEVIDAAGRLPGGTIFEGPAGLRRALLEQRDEIASTVTARMLAFALGRPARYTDMPTVRAILSDAAPREYTWSALIVGIVASDPFQKKRQD